MIDCSIMDAARHNSIIALFRDEGRALVIDPAVPGLLLRPRPPATTGWHCRRCSFCLQYLYYVSHWPFWHWHDDVLYAHHPYHSPHGLYIHLGLGRHRYVEVTKVLCVISPSSSGSCTNHRHHCRPIFFMLVFMTWFAFLHFLFLASSSLLSMQL